MRAIATILMLQKEKGAVSMNGTFATILRVILLPSLLFLSTLCKMKRNSKEETGAPIHAYTVIRQP